MKLLLIISFINKIEYVLNGFLISFIKKYIGIVIPFDFWWGRLGTVYFIDGT